MRFRTWPVLAVALGGLLLLVVAAIFATSRKTALIYGQFERLAEDSNRVQTELHELRSNVLLTGILVRDYLLNSTADRDAEIKQTLAAIQARNGIALDDLAMRLGPKAGERLATLGQRLDSYWAGLEPVFGWSAERRLEEGPLFLDRKSRTTREAVIAIVEEIEGLNRESTVRQRASIAVGERDLRQYLSMVFWVSTSIGLLVAGLATVRLSVLERHAEEQRLSALESEHEMRQLSLRLVRAQETERRTLSRELHDHVGQILTALRMELGRAERVRAQPQVFTVAIAEAKQLTETIMRTVRDLAMGLRPSMLDDFGLRPALEWHVRDFSRRSGVPVDLSITGDVDRLPERHRTAVYRIVQEALTNCARHAQASHVSVTLSLDDRRLVCRISDDGVGMAPGSRRTGLGLIGIDERVRELNGTVTVKSGADRGTAITIELPRPPAAEEETHLAHLAG